MEPKGSLPYSHQPANDPYPEPYEFSPHPLTHFSMNSTLPHTFPITDSTLNNVCDNELLFIGQSCNYGLSLYTMFPE
jgi:hypothetical protein